MLIIRPRGIPGKPDLFLNSALWMMSGFVLFGEYAENMKVTALDICALGID